MRGLLIVFLLMLGACVAQRINQAELNDRGLVMRRIQCILDQGPCDRTGAQLKAALPEVLKRNCRKCTPEQKAGARRLIKFAEQRYPNEWNQIKAKYGA